MKENISSSSKSIQLTARHLYRHFTQVKLALFGGNKQNLINKCFKTKSTCRSVRLSYTVIGNKTDLLKIKS